MAEKYRTYAATSTHTRYQEGFYRTRHIIYSYSLNFSISVYLPHDPDRGPPQSTEIDEITDLMNHCAIAAKSSIYLKKSPQNLRPYYDLMMKIYQTCTEVIKKRKSGNTFTIEMIFLVL